MTVSQGSSIPSIKIFISRSFGDEAVLREIKSGVEEESVPCEVVRANEDDGIALSHAAAVDSVLEVGIGADAAGCLCVHYAKLPPQSPLFKINYNGDFGKIRSVCSNAARLVKGIPFILD